VIEKPHIANIVNKIRKVNPVKKLVLLEQ